MSNCACGVLRVVAKNKETVERVFRITDYKDDEFCLYRCKDCAKEGEARQAGDFWVLDIYVDGANSCEPFFDHGDCPDKKVIIGEEKGADGKPNYDAPIYGKCHFSDFSHICKVLDCGVELYDTEGGNGFWEHFVCDHNGYLTVCESGDYTCEYPTDENGDDIENSDPIEKFDIDYFGKYADPDEIYGYDD